MTKDRRSFLKESSMVMAAGGFNTRQGSAPDAPFVHHVLFWLKDKGNKEFYGRLVAALKQLRKVDTVRFLHVGAPSISDIEFEARATDATYTVSYLALFDSKDDKEHYLRHPLHTKFVEDFGPSTGILTKVVIYDSLRIPD
jgi:Stress responsive A/B Barrel Domain